MEYSTHYNAILYLYIAGLAGVVLFSVALIAGEIYLIKQYTKDKSIVEFVGAVAIPVIFVLLTIFYSSNYILDIPYAIKNDYTIATGTATGWDTTGKGNTTKSFNFTTDDGTSIDLFILSSDSIHQGDRFEVMFLPHTGCGAIVKQLSKV
ncbi:MAG: hypothetical protein LBS74_09775, partial [Oscillospiraceae bacterium]|jgi:hypothetical protein|nr:hypothetical protein [Oscillospiraceae bacterium]